MAWASKETREYVETRVLETEGKVDYNALCEEVKDKIGEVLTYDQVRHMVWRIKKMRSKIAEVNSAVEDEKRYDVVGNDYVLKYKDKIWRFSISEVDAIFHDFSVHGNNLSSEEIRQKYELKPEAWELIKSRFRLYKHSHVFSPHTAETLNEEELEEKIEEATVRHVDKIKQKMVITHEKRFKQEALKAMRIIGNIDEFLGHMSKFLESYEPRDVDFDIVPPPNDTHATYVISDIHIGKTGTDRILKRLSVILEDAKRSPAGHLDFTILGDLVETISQDGMHPGQIAYWTDHEYGKYGFDLMMDTVRILENFFIEIRKTGKKVHVRGIAGNHWRMTWRKEDDKQRTGELCIYEFLRRGLANVDIDVEYFRQVLNAYVTWNANFILMHGDGKVGKDNPEKILLSHGQYGKYNVILGGDWHTLKTHEGKWFVYLRVPALAGPWEYDTDMNLHSEPGYAVINDNCFGTVDIQLKRLPK